VQQDSACSFSVRQDSDINTQGTAPVYVIDMSEEQININIVSRFLNGGETLKKFLIGFWGHSIMRLEYHRAKTYAPVEHTTQ
jgi:hypothetical protein